MIHTTLPRSAYVPKGAVRFAVKGVDAEFYVAEAVRAGQPVFHAMAFLGRARKPSWNYTFRKHSAMEAYIRQSVEAMKARGQYTVERKAKAAAFVHSVKVGDIYRTSWGYDQTNVEFFEVVDVRGKMAVLREICTAAADDGQGSERCVPQSGAYVPGERGEPIRRLIQDGRIKIDDVRSAWPWGERVAGVVVGRAAHRTAAGWGH